MTLSTCVWKRGRAAGRLCLEGWCEWWEGPVPDSFLFCSGYGLSPTEALGQRQLAPLLWESGGWICFFCPSLSWRVNPGLTRKLPFSVTILLCR